MEVQSLSDIYSSSGLKEGTVYVVPKIRYQHKDSDYLYLLYEPVLKQNNYRIESVSVFGHIKFVIKAITSKNVLLHYHWFEFQDFKALSGMSWKVLCIFTFKLFGGKLVWTVHNLKPHDRKWLKFHKFIQTWLAKKADHLHVHCISAMVEVSEFLSVSSSKISVLPHPDFPVKHYSKFEAIQYLNSKFSLSLDTNLPLILFFGNISNYKRIEEALIVLNSIDIKHQVLIAGPVKKGQINLLKILEDTAQKHSNIKILPSFIQDEWIPYIFSASDISFFNFDDILTSGSFQMALDYDKKIIAPNKGCLSEFSEADNVFLFNSDSEMKSHIRNVLEALNYE